MNSEPRTPARKVKSSLQLVRSKEKRFKEIIQCLARGLTWKEISVLRGVSYDTIRHHGTEMRAYFGAETTAELVLIARREWNLDL